MNWLDFALNVCWLAAVPLALAAYGGHLAAENISDAKARRRSKCWFWSLCFLGIAMAAVSQYRSGRTDEARNKIANENDLRRSAAEQEAKQAQVDLSDFEKRSSRRLIDLEGQLNKLLLRPQPEAQRIDELRLKSEIAAAVAERVTPPPRPDPLIVQQPVISQAPHDCRGDALKDCTDEELLEWGKPLVLSIHTTVDQYMGDLKKLDGITGGNWLGQLVGIGDKDSRWLRAYAQAQEKAAEHFGDCCAANVLIYHNELLQRAGGEQKSELYRWVEDLTKSPASKDYKKARQDSKVLDVQIDIDQLQFSLRSKDIKSRAVHSTR